MAIYTFALAVLLSNQALLAQQEKKSDSLVNTEVMTTDWNVEFKLAKRVVGKVDLGQLFYVDKVNGNWIHVMGKSGWIHKRNTVPKDKAILHFSVELRKSRGAKDYHHRGLALMAMESYDKAVADYDRAIEMSPGEGAYYNSRAKAYHNKGDYEAAMKDYNKALELSKDNAKFLNNRGILYRDMKQYDKAIADHDQAIKLQPLYAEAYNSRAWLYATSDNAKFIRARKAVEDAKRACELTGWHDDVMVGTLSAAYARAGKFTEAKKWIKSAMTMNPYRFTDKRKKMNQMFDSNKAYTDSKG